MRRVFQWWYPNNRVTFAAGTDGTVIHDHFERPSGLSVEDIYQELAFDPKDVQMVTCLREPFFQIQSLYHYWRTANPEQSLNVFGDWTALPNIAKDFEEFIGACPYNNRQYLPEGADAKEILDQFALVGVYEGLDDWCHVLAQWLGFGMPAAIPRINVTLLYEWQIELRKLYREMHPEEYELYDEALRRWKEIRP